VTTTHSSSTKKRIEIKDVFSPFELSKFESAIKLSSLSFYNPYPSRQINSIYFDDYSYSSLVDSIEGNSLRTKIRIRWYGTEKNKVNGTLEIKKKQGIFSWKHLHKNKFFINPEAKSWNEMIEQKGESKLVDTLLLNHKPRSIISYSRQYFCSFDEKIRITIDQDLQSFSQNSPIGPNLDQGRKHYNFLIIEVKVSSKDEHLLELVRRDIPFVPRRFSKYCESLLPQKYFYLF
jgi:SPX domain protein involved in polyphosphate accumulation